MKQVLGISTAFILLLVSATFIATRPQDDSGRSGANIDGNWPRNSNSGTTSTGTTSVGRRRRRRGRQVMTTTNTMTAVEGEVTDLSGTYTGTLSCAGLPISGEGTLTITGNQFTFTPTGGGPAASGRITAVTTRGYTAVALQFGESTAPPPGGTSTPPVIISLRARREGDRLILSGVPNTATSDCSFSSGGGNMGSRRRRRGGGNTNTNMSGDRGGNANMTIDTGAMSGNMNMGSTGSRRRRRRGGDRTDFFYENQKDGNSRSRNGNFLNRTLDGNSDFGRNKNRPRP